MGELRDRMHHDLVVRGLSERTQEAYTDAVVGLAKYYRRSPDQLTQREVEVSLVHLTEERKLELARNRLKYTVLHAPRSGIVTAVRFEVGQVVAEGQPVVSIANQGEPEIVVDVPEDHLAAFKGARYKAWLAAAPDQTFEVVLRELAPQVLEINEQIAGRLVSHVDVFR